MIYVQISPISRYFVANFDRNFYNLVLHVFFSPFIKYKFILEA